MITIIIADDHPLMREGIKKIIADEVDISVSNEARNGSELRVILEEDIPDILILDLDMPGTSGIAFLKQVHKLYPDMPILILSVHPAKRYAFRALKAGAQGYLNKNHITEKFIKAIHKIVRQKRKYIPEDVGEQLAMKLNAGDGPLHETLSDREFEVFCMISKGKNVKTISYELSLSKDTVYTYRSRIIEKTGLETNVQMARYAIERNLID